MANFPRTTPEQLRSRYWFDNPDHLGTTMLCIGRYLNYGITLGELTSGTPITGICQSGPVLTPCNRHHIDLVKQVKNGIRAAGGVPFEFPLHPIHENVRRPTATLDPNLTYLSLVEVLSGEPMLNGWHGAGRLSSGTIIWELRKRLAEGDIDYVEFLSRASDSAPSLGQYKTMAEVFGIKLPGSAVIPALYNERAKVPYDTGTRIVDAVWEGMRPLDRGMKLAAATKYRDAPRQHPPRDNH